MKCVRCNTTSSAGALYCEHCGERFFKAKIRLVDRMGNDTTHYVFTHDYVIGRDEECDIVLSDPAVSRRHAAITYEDGVFHIENLKSKNGTLVNSKEISKVALNNYDCIQIGAARLYFYFSEGDFPEDRIHTHTGEFIQETLMKISREIQSKNMLDEVLTAILDGVVALTNARDAMLWMPDESGEWQPRMTRNIRLFGDSGDLQTRVRTLVEQMASNGKHYVYHKSGRQEFIQNMNVVSGLPCRMLALSMRSRKIVDTQERSQKVLGVIVLRIANQVMVFDSRKISLLESLTTQAVVAIENALLYSEALAKRKIDNELELAQQIQNRLLPREIVSVPRTDIAAFSRAHSYVGGDYYDLLHVRDEALAIAIADISGKGIGAALVMSCLQGSLRAQIGYEDKPEHIVCNINQLIRESTAENLFATFFFAVYEYETGALHYVNAGHNPPLVIRTDGTHEFLKSSAAPLGILEENRGTEATITLKDGDVVLFYTDGLTEAMDEDMNQLGMNAVKDCVMVYVSENPQAQAREILDFILRQVEKHTAGQPQHDDLTLLVMKVSPAQ